MSSTILIRRSSTAGSVPTTAQLTAGELAINLADKKIYTNTGSSIIELGTIASTMDVEGALGVDGDFDVNTNKFTVASATGNTSIAGTLDVTGNSQVDGDFTVLGAISIEEPTANSHAATKFYVDQAVTDLIGTAGSALDTLGELADALNDDANFSATVTTALATKLNLAGGTMTGNIVMGANKVTSTATPTTADDLTRKGYIDALYGSTASAAASALAAETAETNAETARDAAQTAQAAAETAETNAASSASSASTSATNASNSASAASTSATSASNSASSASTSASNAATSATNAENAYDNFDDRYLGAKASDPAVDNDGDALITGAMYFDSSNNVMKVYSGTEWQNASSSIEGIKSDFVFTATASQVLFSGSDDNTNTLVIDKAGLVNVYLNGVRLTDADYTIDAPGNSVTLGSGATVGDIVEIEVFGNFAGQSGADVAITGGSITGLTELSTGTFTSTGIDDNATSTAITIDSSENVGIGTASPSTKLEIQENTNSTDVQIRLRGFNSSSAGRSAYISYDPDTRLLGLGEGGDELNIDSSGKVGIGTASPAANSKLHIKGSSSYDGKIIADNSSDTGSGVFSVYQNGTSRGFIGTSGSALGDTSSDMAMFSNGGIRLYTGNGAEKARIDSSGNLLVGTTSANGEGITLNTSNYIYASRNQDEAMYLDRLGNDGNIAVFRKDGSTVGSIASNSDGTLSVRSGLSTGYLKLGGSTGDFYEVASTVFYPTSDNARNLGTTANRFKDLYLSGGVYLGGTGAANKLDDYEEGTFNSGLFSVTGSTNPTYTITTNRCSYVKIGRLVIADVDFNVSISNAGTTSGLVGVALPFNAGNTGSVGATSYSALSGARDNSFISVGDNSLTGYVDINANKVILREAGSGSSNDAPIRCSQLITGAVVRVNFKIMYNVI